MYPSNDSQDGSDTRAAVRREHLREMLADIRANRERNVQSAETAGLEHQARMRAVIDEGERRAPARDDSWLFRMAAALKRLFDRR